MSIHFSTHSGKAVIVTVVTAVCFGTVATTVVATATPAAAVAAAHASDATLSPNGCCTSWT